MKVWTVQSKDVAEEILRMGLYLPDFKKSGYIKEKPGLTVLYQSVLDYFNKNNNCEFSGLIFAFKSYSENKISELNSYEEFKNFITTKIFAIEALWKKFLKGQYVILELEYRENFNTIPIDINDFQFLMPPILVMDPYCEDDIKSIYRNIYRGVMWMSPLYSGIVQVHLPYIKRENVVDFYPMFEI